MVIKRVEFTQFNKSTIPFALPVCLQGLNLCAGGFFEGHWQWYKNFD